MIAVDKDWVKTPYSDPIEWPIVNVDNLPPGTEVEFYSPDFEHSRGRYTVEYSEDGRIAFNETLKGVVPGDVAIYTRDGYVTAQTGKIVQWTQRGTSTVPMSDEDFAKLTGRFTPGTEQFRTS